MAEEKQINDLVFLQKLKLWSETAVMLENVKEQEMKLRLELFGAAFPEVAQAPSKVGSFTALLPHGWKFKVEAKLNTRVDDAALPAVLTKLQEMQVPTDKLFKYTPSLYISEFKKLSPDAKKVLGDVITQSRGAPKVTLVAPTPPKPEQEPE
jgi:hypothetical protein